MPTQKNNDSKDRMRSCRTRLLALPLLAVACLIGLLSGAASASTTDTLAKTANPCSGRSHSYIVQRFFRGPAVYPLRCGTNTWGYTHLIIGHEYYPSAIALTIARGQPDPVFQIFTFVISTNTCPTVTYKVVYNDGPLNGTGVRPQGIITAYPVVSESAPDAKQPACVRARA
jgi:hypothetical protein